MLASSGLLILIGLITSYLFLYRHLERWLRPMDSEREPHRDARSPMMRRSHFGRLGQLLDRAHEAISGKRAMEHMVAFLAHEMKNPISAVQLHLDLLERTTDPDTRFRLIQDIREANARMARVTGRLLEIGAIERQSRIGSFEVISLRGLLESVMEQQSEVADRCEVRLQRTDDGDGEVRGDRTLLEQALGNLIQNAIDYSSPGDTVELEVEIHEQQIDIRVRDHGSGIPMEALNQIFDKYFSLPKQSSGRKGTGIGLSVVQEVADLHHGNIALLNHKDGGVLAVLTLPR
jgi:two-component system sensor histidine kinase CreC